MQDVARAGSRQAWNEGGNVSDGSFKQTCHSEYCGLSGLGTTTARHARRRARAVLTSGRLVAGTWLADDHG